MNTTNQSNTLLLHANSVRSIDDQTLAVDVPGGMLTLIFTSRDAMRHTASVIIAATDLSAPVTIDELAVAFQASTVDLIPRIPVGTGCAAASAAVDESEDEDTATEDEESGLPNLNDDDTDATESIGDVGLTQELNF